jgi:hypothetical protein
MVNKQRFTYKNAPRSLINILILMATTIPIALPITPAAQAEIPPGSYDKLRISAEEALIIKVIKVDTRLSGSREFTAVSVTAKVVAVQRSKKGLKLGSEISIDYESQKLNSTMPGPRRIIVLGEGKYYPAFLNISDGKQSYTPAAYGESFRMTPEN